MVSTMYDKPNLRYDHLYVALRLDKYLSSESERISVLKIFTKEDEAQAEVERLNSLVAKRKSANDSLSCEYFYQVGRIKKGLLTKD
jgi:ABC-type enterochelin transport system substrate-binding protein